MGVSLERVQFKFASIIGELCSEPDVLSQFAVWLDLRLAEYKLKGAISLDCSGEEPDPIWLKGLNKIKTMKSENTSSFSPQTSSYHESSEIVPSMDASERLSPEVVFVKDEIEPLPDVFRRGGVDSQALRIRKRPSNETSTYSSDHFSSQSLSSPPKQRRLSPHEDSPSNQSLMSVLSGVKGDTQESDTRGDYSVLPGPSSTSAMAAINADSMGETADQFNDGSFSNSQMALSDWDALQHPTDASQNNALGPGVQETSAARSYSSRIDPNTPNAVQNNMRRSFIRDIDSLARTTIKNMVVSAGIFERWLWEQESTNCGSTINQPSGFPLIFELPPQLLDRHLTKFFSTIRTPIGNEYKARSLETLRWGIDRYLKSTGYPESIATCPVFYNSQLAFKTKFRQLQSNDLYTSVPTPNEAS